MSVSDQDSIMPFLRNEFTKIFEDLFTKTLFKKKTQIYDQTWNLKLKLNRYRQKCPKVDASIFDSALSHTRRSDASDKKKRRK